MRYTVPHGTVRFWCPEHSWSSRRALSTGPSVGRLTLRGRTDGTMTTDVNILIRGQSNALLFVADGGARELEKQLEASLPGVNVNIIQHYGDKNSTIYSGTAFLKWDTDGQQQGLLNYV